MVLVYIIIYFMISCCTLLVLSCEKANTLGPFQATPLKPPHELLHFAFPSQIDLNTNFCLVSKIGQF